MSFTPDTAFVKQYESLVQMAAAQKESRLYKAVLKQNLVGEEGYLEQLGSVSMKKRTTRNGELSNDDIDHLRRKYIAETYDSTLWIDKDDEVQLLINRPMAYAMRQAQAAAVQQDDLIITAFDATAYTGKAGGTSTAFAAANIIAVDHEVPATTTNLTVSKMRRALTKLKEAEAIDAGVKTYIVCSANNIENLLKDSTVTSADYNTVKALVSGEINSYLGFEFIRSERLGLSSGGYRKVFAFTEDAMTYVNSRSLSTQMDVLPQRAYSLQVYTSMRAGAVRNFENKIVQILCDETK